MCPRYSSGEFLPWLRAYAERHQIRAIVPSESLLLALRPVFEEFRKLLLVGGSQAEVFAGLSKFDLFTRLMTGDHESAAADHLPPTILVPDTEHPPDMERLHPLVAPLYIKVDGSYANPGENGAVFKVASAEVARARLIDLAPRFRKAVIQGHVPGQGVGAFFLLRGGEVIAEFMHRRLHEVPHTGGASSLRQSWSHRAIRDDALRKLRQMNWQGVAMMEYRWDPSSDRFYLLEMNGRFWGSLHLALWSEVDFPLLLLDSFHGRSSMPVRQFPLGVRCRYTLPGELQYVWSRLRDSRLGILAKCGSVFEFFALSADPRVHSDLLFPGDRRLYWREVWRTLSTLRDFLRRRG